MLNKKKYLYDLQNWLSQYEWDFFCTTTFENVISDKTIYDHINGLYTRCYWVERLVWTQEKTELGLPHVHSVIKTLNPSKSEKTLEIIFKKWGNTQISKYRKADEGKVFEYLFKEYPINSNYDIIGDFRRQ